MFLEGAAAALWDIHGHLSAPLENFLCCGTPWAPRCSIGEPPCPVGLHGHLPVPQGSSFLLCRTQWGRPNSYPVDNPMETPSLPLLPCRTFMGSFPLPLAHCNAHAPSPLRGCSHPVGPSWRTPTHWIISPAHAEVVFPTLHPVPLPHRTPVPSTYLLTLVSPPGCCSCCPASCSNCAKGCVCKEPTSSKCSCCH